jgi:SAM-dependent methyltransferase
LICLINNKNGNILELGFGAGREIEFLLKKGYKNIYGIEGSEKFLELVKKELKNENKYKNIADNLYYSVLPEINIPKDIKFDLIFSTFVWNHLPEIMYERTVKNIMNLLKSNGKVLIAYYLDNNENQEIVRYNINEEYLIELFEKYGMELSKKEKMKGSYKIDDNEISENSFDFKVLVFNKKKN